MKLYTGSFRVWGLGYTDDQGILLLAVTGYSDLYLKAVEDLYKGHHEGRLDWKLRPVHPLLTTDAMHSILDMK